MLPYFLASTIVVALSFVYLAFNEFTGISPWLVFVGSIVFAGIMLYEGRRRKRN
jgi:O-antigen/teichoic acid export membrane protein